jgi:hypothetical protein
LRVTPFDQAQNATYRGVTPYSRLGINGFHSACEIEFEQLLPPICIDFEVMTQVQTTTILVAASAVN